MIDFPKISIITPNFNGGAYLEETIQSVLSQNYPNLEYIIIDGGSTDDSIDIIIKYEKQLTYWVSEPDNGLYDAVQKGFDKSTGEIMAWINSDDLYHPKAFFTVAEIFSTLAEVNWLQGIPSVLDEMSRTVAVAPIKRWSKLDYYLGNFRWIQQESIFWRRNLWEKSGEKMAVEMKYAGDLELWLRFFRFDRLYVTAALLGGFRQRSKGQLSLEFLDQYVAEAKEKIREEVENKIPIIEKELVINIKKYNALINIVPFKIIRRILNKILYVNFYKIKKLNFEYSPVIGFDRLIQEFKIYKL
jgi:glycosyltransferase involved in cell wall biosynthesis